MKKRIELVGIIAIMSIIGFTMVSCGDSGSGDPSIPGHTHSWGAWSVTTAPNFSTPTAGEETRTCSGCGTSEKQPYPIRNIGDTGPGGGVIFYRSGTAFGSNWHYLEATSSATNVAWSLTFANVTGATGIAIGAGKDNTTAIITAHPGDANNAAKATQGTIGGKRDWFLPSKDELNEMYNARINLGISSGWYWSSSQVTSNTAWAQDFASGSQSYVDTKDILNIVRAIRAF